MSGPPEIVITKRRAALEDGHHGGAWKIAFADFMTAMMAFFLVLWIISATDKNTKTLIARYFNPVKLEEPAKAQKGIRGDPERNTDAPKEGTGAPKAEMPRSDQGESVSGTVAESTENPQDEASKKHPGKPEPMPPPDPAKPYPTMSEEELFSDPRASLDKIAGTPPPGPRLDPSAAMKGYGEVGPSADEALRDPFRPLGSERAINTVATDAGKPAAPAAASDKPTPTSAPEAPVRAGRRPRRRNPGQARSAVGRSARRQSASQPEPRATRSKNRSRQDSRRRGGRPARRSEEAARRPRAGRPPGRGSTSKRPMRAFLSASPTNRISPCSPLAPPNRNRA